MTKAVYMRTPSGEVFKTSYPQYHPECENLGSGTKAYAARQAYAQKALREFIKPGTMVYGLVRSVSRSGMSRVISFYVTQNGELRNIDSLMADACALSAASDGLKVHGCGMDMIFASVYSLGRALYPEGFGKPGTLPTGRKVTPKTKASAARYVAAGAVFSGRNGDGSGWDRDGGYALRYSSI